MLMSCNVGFMFLQIIAYYIRNTEFTRGAICSSNHGGGGHRCISVCKNIVLQIIRRGDMDPTPPGSATGQEA